MSETTEGARGAGGARAKVIAAALAVFVLGCVTGAALDSAYRLRGGGRRRTPHGQQGRDDFFKSLQKNLDLDARQTEQIRGVIDETRAGYRQLQTEVSPRYDALRRDGRARIRALLTPEQQQKFDRMTAERDARRQSEERRDGEERRRP